MLANAGREHQGIHAAHRHRQCANRLSNPVGVDRQGQLGALMTCSPSIEHRAHVARKARHPQQTRFVIERRFDPVRSQAVVLLDVQHDARIDRAAARAHHQAFQGRKAHGRVDATTPAHCRGGATVAKMANHESQPLRRPAEQFFGAPGYSKRG